MQEFTKDLWPRGLFEIPQIPDILYIRGAPPPPNLSLLCVVGARKYTEYGKKVCQELIAGLAGFSVGIVSGLAIGIDTVAHESALKANLYTIAVPGSGLDRTVLYPRQNEWLAHQILDSGGALISEYESTLRAAPWTFPQRNRIMVGMSSAVLIIEAEEKSGTLITARLALDYNRDVLAVPGSIYSANSWGPHNLIKDGATPITNQEDLRNALGFTTETKKEIDYSSCTPEEKVLLDLLKNPLERSVLQTKSNFSISTFSITISLLELKGFIEERGGKMYKI